MTITDIILKHLSAIGLKNDVVMVSHFLDYSNQIIGLGNMILKYSQSVKEMLSCLDNHWNRRGYKKKKVYDVKLVDILNFLAKKSTPEKMVSDFKKIRVFCLKWFGLDELYDAIDLVPTDLVPTNLVPTDLVPTTTTTTTTKQMILLKKIKNDHICTQNKKSKCVDAIITYFNQKSESVMTFFVEFDKDTFRKFGLKQLQIKIDFGKENTHLKFYNFLAQFFSRDLSFYELALLYKQGNENLKMRLGFDVSVEKGNILKCEFTGYKNSKKKGDLSLTFLLKLEIKVDKVVKISDFNYKILWV